MQVSRTKFRNTPCFAGLWQLCTKTLDKTVFCGKIADTDAGIAHPVERHLAKVEVASSSLVARSTPCCCGSRVFFRACDGIGRHARFRFSYRNVCGFESLQAHHFRRTQLFLSLVKVSVAKTQYAESSSTDRRSPRGPPVLLGKTDFFRLPAV